MGLRSHKRAWFAAQLLLLLFPFLALLHLHAPPYLRLEKIGEILGRGYLRDQCQRIRDSSGKKKGVRWRGQNEFFFFFARKRYWDCFTLFVGVALTPFLTSKGGENGTGETVRTSHLPKRLFSSMVDYRSEMILRILAIWPIYTQEQSVCERETSPF